jgi:hypothetical protein
MSQCRISLEDLATDDERNQLHFEIVDIFDRALNAEGRRLDQAVDQMRPASTRNRSGTGSDQSAEGQQSDSRAEKLADELDELW